MGSRPIPCGAQLTPIWHPSPNFGPRRDGARPDLIVLHYTAMSNAQAARDWLCTEAAHVSAHYVIAPDGTTWHLVDEAHRAWHAGVGAWGPVTDVNSRSIGIEMCNTGTTPFAARQMDALETLLADIMARHGLPPERVIAHSDIAPGRKIDPGPRFDWHRLARLGLSIWPDPNCLNAAPDPALDPDTELFPKTARRFGYTADVPPDALLHSFRLRFRPGATGPMQSIDSALMAHLAQRWPVAGI